MRIQGIEPWSVPWEGTMIPLHQMRFASSYHIKIVLHIIFSYFRNILIDPKWDSLITMITFTQNAFFHRNSLSWSSEHCPSFLD